MSKTWTTYPRVASPEAAADDAADHADCLPDEEEEWETDPALLADLDAEMQEQAEEGALLAAQMTAPAGGGSEEEPW